MRLTHVLKSMERLPLLGPVLLRLLTRLTRGGFRDSSSYWERRYTSGGTSGTGSVGAYAKFKAEVVNGFVRERRIASVIEFGCGDGNQLSLMEYPRYVGLDVSRSAIALCKKRFAGVGTRQFFLYDPLTFAHSRSPFSAEVAISLDVIYHLVEDDVFEKYLADLFSAATEYVIIFSSDTDANPAYLAPHVKHRRFSETVSRKIPGWRLIQKIPNPVAQRHDAELAGTAADFYIYQKH